VIAKKYLIANQMKIVVVGDKEKIADQLKQYESARSQTSDGVDKTEHIVATGGTGHSGRYAACRSSIRKTKSRSK